MYSILSLSLSLWYKKFKGHCNSTSFVVLDDNLFVTSGKYETLLLIKIKIKLHMIQEKIEVFVFGICDTHNVLVTPFAVAGYKLVFFCLFEIIFSFFLFFLVQLIELLFQILLVNGVFFVFQIIIIVYSMIGLIALPCDDKRLRMYLYIFLFTFFLKKIIQLGLILTERNEQSFDTKIRWDTNHRSIQSLGQVMKAYSSQLPGITKYSHQFHFLFV